MVKQGQNTVFPAIAAISGEIMGKIVQLASTVWGAGPGRGEGRVAWWAGP
jgi:hypothetical protein